MLSLRTDGTAVAGTEYRSWVRLSLSQGRQEFSPGHAG